MYGLSWSPIWLYVAAPHRTAPAVTFTSAADEPTYTSRFPMQGWYAVLSRRLVTATLPPRVPASTRIENQLFPAAAVFVAQMAVLRLPSTQLDTPHEPAAPVNLRRYGRGKKAIFNILGEVQRRMHARAPCDG